MKRILGSCLWLGALAGCVLDVKTHGSFSRSSTPAESPPSPVATTQPAATPARAPGRASSAHASPVEARPAVAVAAKPAEPPYNQAVYDACVADFEREYDAWAPTDKAAKAVIAKVQGKSPYEALPALLAAYDAVDKKSTKRQNGQWPPGSLYAPATHLELMMAMADIGVKTHANTCIDAQFEIDMRPDFVREYRPPLTGDRDQDKAIQCGGPNGAQRIAAEARQKAFETFNANNAVRHKETLGGGTGGDGGRLVSITTNAKETVLAFRHTHPTGECVANGRWKMGADGSVGQQCDWVYGKDEAEAKVITYHLSPATKLPVKLQRGDDFSFRYELDPDAPAGDQKVALKGGWWQLEWATRGDNPVFQWCHMAGSEVEIRTPLQTIGRWR